MTTTKSYDKLNRLAGMISTPSGGGQLPFSYGASYNEANQRITVTMNDGSYWVYEYDTLGQITSAKKHFSDGAFVPGQQFTYSHLKIGNRTSSTIGGTETGGSSGSSTYQTLTNTVNQYLRKDRPLGFGVMGTAGVNESVLVNGLEPTYRRGEYFWKWMSVTNRATLWTNVVVTSGSETKTGSIFMAGWPEYFTYDLDGNMLSDGRWNYTWDAENRLTRMMVNTNVGPQLQLDFQYDWMGRRISKTVKTNGVTSYSRKFLYDGWNLIAELDGNNALVRSYTWGLDASGSMQGAGGVGGLLMVNAGTNGVHFPAYDLNGNVMGLVNAANGNISAKYEYGPFGEVFCAVGDMASVNPFGFSTKYTDTETDLVYYGYRYYSPALGRWLSRDPIEERGGLNLYGFVNNDPVNKWDILGYIDYFMMQHPGRISDIVDMIGDPNGDYYNNPIDYYQAWRRGLTPHSRIFYSDSKMTQSMMESLGVKSERNKMIMVIRSILCEAGDRVSIDDKEFGYAWSETSLPGLFRGLKNVFLTWNMTQQFVGSYSGKVGFQGIRTRESCCCTIRGLLSFELTNTTSLRSYYRFREFFGLTPHPNVYEGPFANSTQIYRWTENIIESNCIDIYNIQYKNNIHRNSIPQKIYY